VDTITKNIEKEYIDACASMKACHEARDKEMTRLTTMLTTRTMRATTIEKTTTEDLRGLENSTLALQDMLLRCQAAHNLPRDYEEWIKEIYRRATYQQQLQQHVTQWTTTLDVIRHEESKKRNSFSSTCGNSLVVSKVMPYLAVEEVSPVSVDKVSLDEDILRLSKLSLLPPEDQDLDDFEIMESGSDMAALKQQNAQLMKELEELTTATNATGPCASMSLSAVASANVLKIHTLEDKLREVKKKIEEAAVNRKPAEESPTTVLRTQLQQQLQEEQENSKRLQQQVQQLTSLPQGESKLAELKRKLSLLQSQVKASEEFLSTFSNSHEVNYLVSMGFSMDNVKKALAENGNNLDQAAEWLISHVGL